MINKILTCLIIIVPYITIGQSIKMLSIKEQVEDIEYIKSELVKLHPGIYSFQSVKEFNQGFDSLIKNLRNDQSIFQFYKQLVPIINRIGCGHTLVKFPKKDLNYFYKNNYFLPFRVNLIDDRIFIEGTNIQNPYLQIGTEIISIDSIPVAEYIHESLKLYPSDGRIMSRKYQSLEQAFSLDYSKFNTHKKSFNLLVKNTENIDSVYIIGIRYEELASLIRPENKRNLNLYFIDSLSIAVITIRNSGSRKRFSAFLNESFQEIRKKQSGHLIIDLRYDSFNHDSDGAELYSYLTNEPFSYYSKLEVTENYDVPKPLNWIAHYPIKKGNDNKYYWTAHPQLEIQQPKTGNYNGNVYIIVDGFTFSATSEFSSIVKSNQRGLIIGKETGGSYYGNNSGGMLYRKLPNSNLKVIIPPMKYYLAVKDLGNYSRGVLPDTLVEETINQLDHQDNLPLNTTIMMIKNLIRVNE
jgi:hypothetical protein